MALSEVAFVTQPQPEPGPELPRTGVNHLDQALAELGDLDELPVTEHHDRLIRVATALQDALQHDGGALGGATQHPAPPRS